jgi:hypothetical protein
MQHAGAPFTAFYEAAAGPRDVEQLPRRETHSKEQCMKNDRQVWSLLAAFAMGCAAEDGEIVESVETYTNDDGTTVEEFTVSDSVTHETVRTGTAEQAVTYTLHNDHGYRSPDYMRCKHNPKNYSSSNYCGHPPNRNLKVRFNTDTFSTCQGALDQFRNGVARAVLESWARGWSLQYDEGINTTDVNVIVNCVCNSVPADKLAVTTITVPPTTELRPWIRATVKLDVCRLIANSAYAAASNEGKLNIEDNLAMHEMGHVLGMGHHSEAGACSNRLMSTNQGSCFATARLGFNATERAMLSTFNVQ